jgi:dihydroorotase
MNAGMKTMDNSMSSVLNLGASFADVIAMSTWNPAKQIKRPELGHVDVGAEADIAVLRRQGPVRIHRLRRRRLPGSQRIVTELTLRAGRVVCRDPAAPLRSGKHVAQASSRILRNGPGAH